MTSLILWTVGIACIGLSSQQDDDIPTIAAAASGVILLCWGFLLMPAQVQMGAEAIAVGLLLSGRRLELDSH
jgi:hypothetical protein